MVGGWGVSVGCGECGVWWVWGCGGCDGVWGVVGGGCGVRRV